jgi:phosphate transport system protein
MSEKKAVESWLYSSDKERISGLVLKMGEMTAEALNKAVDALFSGDEELAREVIRGDDKIDAIEKEIDHECLRSIAMRQPVRDELRFIFAVLKNITDIERIADQAVNIAGWALDLHKYPRSETSPVISEMRDIAEAMLRDALTAFRTSDAELAKDTCCQDDRLDRIYMDVFNDFIELMAEGEKDAAMVRVGVGQMWMARHLERVGDHVTNVAERVYFMITGEILDKKNDLPKK